jgi:hypothetical protein
MIPGHLYEVYRYSWLSFRLKETLVKRLWEPESWPPTRFNDAEGAANSASYWSHQYNCDVSYIPSDSSILCLEEDKNFRKFLTADGQIYWTWFEDEDRNDFVDISP